MSPIEIKNYFDSNPPPASHDWKPWAKIADCNLFLHSCYRTIGSHKGDPDSCPAYWRLNEFYLEMVKINKANSGADPQK